MMARLSAMDNLNLAGKAMDETTYEMSDGDEKQESLDDIDAFEALGNRILMPLDAI